MLSGLIGNIQHYSIHDGPGIRSTVFLKGCLLSCQWCHNPEEISMQAQLYWEKAKCLGCGDCINVCPCSALRLNNDSIDINENICEHCGVCAALCPSLALELLGKTMTVPEVLQVVKKDMLFYESSGGGVTLSGGEPLLQAEFAASLLHELQREGIHTVLDTSGYAPFEQIAACASYTDLFLYDIKHLDAQFHQQLTGIDNTLILDNLHKLAELGADIWLRTPVIPSFNDAVWHINAIGNLARKLGIKDVYLLPYHHLAQGKYEKLGQVYKLPGLAEPAQEHMEALLQILLDKGLNAYIGG
ncbi:MAG: glycyl-radical enzyme activating protein [Firmicutes bacterium]|nr:glycyl-radical enzyme activating protein [Bacillota bacterium]